MSISLQNHVKQQLLEYFSALPMELHHVLIVDPSTLSSLSSALNLSDIMQYNIALIEKLFLKRQPFPQMGAIYLISATEASVEKMLEDWDLKNKIMYKEAYIFFSGRASDIIMTKLKSSRISSHVKQLIELNIEFLPIESQLFTYRDDSDYMKLYGENLSNEQRSAYINKCAEKLASVFATFNDVPYIRYREKSALASAVAQATHSKLKALGRHARLRQSEKSICLVLDRASDPIAPLVHEFTYQAMAYDLLNIGPDQVYTLETEDESRQVLLNEQDSVWVRYRHKLIIPDVRDGIREEYQQFKERNSDLSGNLTKDKSTRKISKVMHRLPEFQKVTQLYSLHSHLISQLMKKFDAQQLQLVGIQVQNLAVNQTETGEDLSKILPKLGPLFKADIPDDVKIRLVLLYLISHGTKQKTMEKILSIANLDDTDEVKGIANSLKLLGINTEKSDLIGSVKKRILKLGKKKKDYSNMLTLCRFQPNVKGLLTDLIGNSLSLTQYPYVVEPSSPFRFEVKASTSISTPEEIESHSRSKRKRPSWVANRLKKSEPEKEETTAPISTYKIVVFIIGGATYSESRCCYEVTEESGIPCYLGSTSMLTPKTFLEKLEELQPDF